MNGTPKEAKGTPAAPAKARGRRPAPKEAAEAGRVWTGERVSVGEGHPAPPETPSSPPVALIPAGEAKPVPAEGEAHWYVVRNTPGVTSFVGSGNKPVPLQEKEIKSIQKQIKAEAPKVRVEYQVGENVRVIDGPFSDFHGKVDEINADKGKLKVLVNMFGRETPVELDLLQVERLK